MNIETVGIERVYARNLDVENVSLAIGLDALHLGKEALTIVLALVAAQQQIQSRCLRRIGKTNQFSKMRQIFAGNHQLMLRLSGIFPTAAATIR
jgi:hypothetical protein